MKTLGLYKKEKLCSGTAIDALFGGAGAKNNAGTANGSGAEFSRLAFPLRAVARRNDRRHSDAPIAFLISVPKKRLRHAVDRVLMRRRVREAYRLCHHDYKLPEGLRVDLAFIYVANTPVPFSAVDRAVHKILESLTNHYCESNTAAQKGDIETNTVAQEYSGETNS